MKEFWNENKKIIGKLFLNQFGAAFFGLMFLLSCQAAKSLKIQLELLSNVVTIIIFLFLWYSLLWEKGAQDRIKIDGGRAKEFPLKGLWIGVIASIPGIIIAILVIVSNPFKETQYWAGSINGIARTIGQIWQSMYSSIVVNFAPKNPIIYALELIPGIFVCFLGYILGSNNKRIFGFLNKKKK